MVVVWDGLKLKALWFGVEQKMRYIKFTVLVGNFSNKTYEFDNLLLVIPWQLFNYVF